MNKPEVKYLKDYTPLQFTIEKFELSFDLYEDKALVYSKIFIIENKAKEIFLDGEELKLISLCINGKEITENEYELSEQGLILKNVPKEFTLSVTTEIYPQKNTALEGLYKSSGNFCTQCEAEGFRKITYFTDRPDMMTKFTCSIEADKKLYPVMLSNGNLIEKGEKDGGRHFVKWEDPFKKPCYLFALVAGDLSCIEDTFTTMSGKEVALEIYVEHENADKCSHAMDSLKKAMKWDEDVFGREYDLDVYMIVAVNDFNMGAMENKGLNVFNSKYVLANPETATDTDYEGIATVIAHEYFHNWTGNRVTLKNWFQLSLKEGLTVFRDQEFTSDHTSRAVSRISEVNKLRNAQFPEDAGPMSHPIMPASYIEMNNFYTVTIYEKGSEVIRMLHTIAGPENFRKGMDLYFQRHDGQAVTTEDFVSAIEDGSGIDLKQFRLWYTQAGTPEIIVKRNYDQEKGELELNFTQIIKDTAGQKDKKEMHIPINIGLVGEDGDDLKLQCDNGDIVKRENFLINLHKKEETFKFKGLKKEPVPSILRGFSAPVILNMDLSDDELIFLLGNDSDSFNRWEAGQRYFSKTILRLVEKEQQGEELTIDPKLFSAFYKILNDKDLDKALIAKAIQFPSESELGFMMEQTDVDGIHFGKEFLLDSIANELDELFIEIYTKCLSDEPYKIDNNSIATRSLKNSILQYIGRLDWDLVGDIVLNQFYNADNMTDEIAAFSVIAQLDVPERESIVSEFYEKWKDDTLVLDKWFAIQASSKLPDSLERVQELMEHEKFSIKNPNKVRALIGSFAGANQWNFHRLDGKGYSFVADQVKALEKLNPQIAARMVSVFNRWRKYDSKRQSLMKEQLQGIADLTNLSRDVFEIVYRALS